MLSDPKDYKNDSVKGAKQPGRNERKTIVNGNKE